MSEKRQNPKDGRAYTWQQFVQIPAVRKLPMNQQMTYWKGMQVVVQGDQAADGIQDFGDRRIYPPDGQSYDHDSFVSIPLIRQLLPKERSAYWEVMASEHPHIPRVGAPLTWGEYVFGNEDLTPEQRTSREYVAAMLALDSTFKIYHHAMRDTSKDPLHPQELAQQANLTLAQVNHALHRIRDLEITNKSAASDLLANGITDEKRQWLDKEYQELQKFCDESSATYDKRGKSHCLTC